MSKEAQPLPAGFIDAVVEAAAILGAVDPDHAPKNMRWPLADELDGFVGMINTAPQAQPAREFVGLTDEEIEQGCKESWVTKQAWQSAVWWAEEKLKEKNNA